MARPRNPRKVSWDAQEFMEKDIVLQNSGPSSPQMLMGEAILHLQGRQKETYLLVMREDKSLSEAAEILGIKKGTAQGYLDNAIAFISQYCQQAINQGRI